MRRIAVPLALLVLGTGLVLSGGCAVDAGSGLVRSEGRAIEASGSLDVSGAFQVQVTKGSSSSATVETDDNLIGEVLLETEGDRLVLRWKDQLKAYEPSEGVKVKLVLPELFEVRASGASEVKVDSLVSESVTMIARGGSRIAASELIANEVSLSLSDDSTAHFQLVDVDVLTCAASGSSRLEATGNGSHLNLSLSGASQAELSGLSTAEVRLDAAGESRAHLSASEALSVEATGESRVVYRGTPKDLRVEESGNSTVRPTS